MIGLFIRSRLGRGTVSALLGAFLIEALLQGRSFTVPLLPWEVVASTTPLLPVIPAVIALHAVEPRFAPFEAITADPRRLRACRFGWGIAVAVGLALAEAAIAYAGDPGSGANALSVTPGPRNVIAFFAVGILSAAVIGADLAWLAPLLLMMTSMFFGRDHDDVVRRWAVLLRPGADAQSWVDVVLVGVVALVLFAWRDLGAVRPREAGDAGW